MPPYTNTPGLVMTKNYLGKLALCVKGKMKTTSKVFIRRERERKPGCVRKQAGEGKIEKEDTEGKKKREGRRNG